MTLTSTKLSPRRLLATPLGAKFLGLDVNADLYAKNGFRLLGLSAGENRDTLAREAGRLRTRIQLSPTSLDGFCIRTGYDEYCPVDAVRCVNRLQDPHFRLLCEVFWPHLSDGAFGLIKSHRHIGTSTVAAGLERAATVKHGREATLLRHAAAIAYHNAALVAEMALVVGTATPDEEGWTRAIQLWRLTLADDQFWSFMRERVAQLDHPHVRPNDVERIRADLPAVLLAFHTRFSEAYAEAGQLELCKKHLRLIQNSDFPYDNLRTALVTGVRKLVSNAVEPLTRQVQEQLLDGSDRQDRKSFVALSTPLLEKICALPAQLRNTFSVEDELLNLTEFDSVCEPLVAALNKRIDYSTDDRERSLLHFLLTVKRLLGLPLSSSLRRKLETEFKDAIKLLYPDCELPEELDVTRCYFNGFDAADPDASLLLPLHKVTGRSVEVDVNRMSGGVRVSFRKYRLLVPRSARSKAQHEGKRTTVSDARGSAEADALWSPPAPTATEPFRFNDGSKSQSVLDLIEAGARPAAQLHEHLLQGRVSAWLDYRQQAKLATKVRQMEQGMLSYSDLLRCLLGVAIVEVNAAVAELAAKSAREIEVQEQDAANENQATEQRKVQALREHEQRVAAEKWDLEARVRKIEEQCGTAIKTEQDRAEQAQAALNRRHGAATAEAEKMISRLAEENEKWDGAWALEVPVIGGLVVLLGAASLTFGNDAAIAFGGIVAGGLTGLGICWKVRGGRLNSAKEKLEQLRREQEGELGRLRKQTEQTIAQQNNDKTQRIATERARLEALEGQKQAIIQESAQLIQTIHARRDQAIQRIQQAAASASEALQKRLLSRLETKRESAKSDYGPYRHIKANGFRDGTQPSSAEMQMTYGEQQEARTRLQMAALLRGIR